MCNWDGTSNSVMIQWRGRQQYSPHDPWIVLITLPGLPPHLGNIVTQMNITNIVNNMVELMYDKGNDGYTGYVVLGPIYWD